MALLLTIDGIDYAEAQMVTAGVSITAIRSAYTDAEPATFQTTDTFDAASPLLKPGQIVRVWIDSTCVAYGKCVEREVSFEPGEGRTFGLISARELARNVPIQHPRTHAPHIDFNMAAASDLQPTALQGLSIGEMIGYLIDQHATELRAQGAATTGTIYDSTVTALMTAEVPEVSVSGDVLSAIEGLLAMTKYALVINPETLVWTFQDRTAGAYYTIDLGTSHARGSMTVSLDRCFTAAELRGSRPETTDTIYSLAQGDFNDGWDASAEASMTGANRWDQTHKTVGKLFELADGDVGIVSELCTKARVTSADGTVDVDVAIRADTPESDPASIAMALPALGLTNAASTVDACDDPADSDGAATGGMSVTIPTYSRASPLVPKQRYPTGSDAWYGSAFSFDSGKWGVDLASPGAGDYGLKRLRVRNAPRYHGTAAEDAAWALVMADVVAIGGTLQRDIRFVIGASLDPTPVLLGMRLRVKDSATSRVTGYENSTDLAIVGVEWDPMSYTTTIYAGTGAGLFDVEAYRSGLAAKQGVERTERSMELMRELMSCFIAQDQAYTATDLPPVQICGSQVSTLSRPGGPPGKVDEVVPKGLGGILEIIESQKGGDFALDVNADTGEGEIKWTNPETGEVYRLRHNGNGWAWVNPNGEPLPYPPYQRDPDGGAGSAPVGGGEAPGGASPAGGSTPPLDAFGPNGWIANAVMGLLANLGKTTDGKGNVLTPSSAPGGTTAPGAIAGSGVAPGATAWGHDPASGGITQTPIPEGGTIPPTTMGGVLGNAAKTTDPTGKVLAPGATIP